MQMNTDILQRTKPVLLKNITKTFANPRGTEESIAVCDFTYEFEEGKLTTMLGPSGCGKTTTLRIIAGFETPTAGEVFLGNQPINNVPPNKRNIGMVFQNYALFPHLTIYENITYGLKVRKLPINTIETKAKKVLDMMQLTGMEKRFPNQLSGGQQQRVALARAIVVEPEVLLFDEPLSNLDAKLREYMRDQLRDLQKRLGITSIYVTHDQEEAMAISDKVIILKSGKIEQIGTPFEIYQNPISKFVAGFMGKANFINVKIVELNEETTIVEMADGHIYKIKSNKNATFSKGDIALAVIRPESIKFTNKSSGIPGFIKNMTFYGSFIQYTVNALDTDLLVEVSNPQKSGIRFPGEEVYLNFDEENMRILQE